jgi:hypothetical protein
MLWSKNENSNTVADGRLLSAPASGIQYLPSFPHLSDKKGINPDGYLDFTHTDDHYNSSYPPAATFGFIACFRTDGFFFKFLRADKHKRKTKVKNVSERIWSSDIRCCLLHIVLIWMLAVYMYRLEIVALSSFTTIGREGINLVRYTLYSIAIDKRMESVGRIAWWAKVPNWLYTFYFVKDNFF